MAESLVTMEQLPDDVLVAVMQFLDLEDVLACRLVCKRLCGLALHRDVWGHRSLADDHPLAGAVLLLAPCLKMLTVTGRVPTLAVTSTWCAVASLRLRQAQGFFNAPAFNPGEYAFIVYKQESLGRLRRLELCHLTCRMNTVADVLVRTVASCSGLESIDVLGYLPVTSHPVVHGPSRSSLTKFRCLVDDYSASFTNAILVGHAATLEEIHILAHDDFEEPATVALFAALPRLCSLRCNDSIRWLEAMAACSTLRDVFICLNKKLDRLERVAKFLRQASQLQRVHLENCAKGLTAEYCTELCEALAASSEQSQLERLALEGFQNVRPLLGVLPSLPALRHLDVTSATPDDALLKSITPATAPALRRLELGVESGQCPHAWVHGTAVEATLVENPALHILVRVWRSGRRRCGPDDCAACAEGCHREVKWNKVGKVGLYSHGPDECPSPEDHADDVDWQKADRRAVTVACTWVHV